MYGTSLQRRASNLLPLLSAAADGAQEEERDGDAVLFAACADLMRSMMALGAAGPSAFVRPGDGDAESQAGRPPRPLVPASGSPRLFPGDVPLKAKPHRHTYSEAGGGPCLELVDGKPCGALSRAAKKAAAAAPAGGGSAP